MLQWNFFSHIFVVLIKIFSFLIFVLIKHPNDFGFSENGQLHTTDFKKILKF